MDWHVTDRGAIEPLELAKAVMDLLNKGRRTATYKLAALSALIDYCDQRVDPATLTGPVEVSIDGLAEVMMGIYWRQVERLDNDKPLLQASKKAAILDEVRSLRDVADVGHRRPCPSLEAAKNRVGSVVYDRSVRRVRLVLVQEPLSRLQRIGTGPRNVAGTCLYDDSWMEGAGQGAIDKHGGVFTLYPGVAAGLVETQLLLRPVIQHLWIEKVWRSNQEMSKLVKNIEEHLFGRPRLPLGSVGKRLKKSFRPECFYCRTALETGGHIDHVLPWSTTKIDGVANLVLSCEPCNTSKSDNLPAIEHVTRALQRPLAELERIADAEESETDYEKMRRAASNRYRRASANHADVWRGRDDFITLDLSSPPDWMLGV